MADELVIGVVAHQDGLFAAVGAAIGRRHTHPAMLLVALLGVVAGVTVVLHLDASGAVFTSVLVLAALARGLDEEPCVYGALCRPWSCAP